MTLEENCQSVLGRCLAKKLPNSLNKLVFSSILKPYASLKKTKTNHNPTTNPEHHKTNAFSIARSKVKHLRSFLSWMLLLSAKPNQESDHIWIRDASNRKPRFWFSLQMCDLDQSLDNIKGDFLSELDRSCEAPCFLLIEFCCERHFHSAIILAYRYLAEGFSLLPIFLYSREKLTENWHTQTQNMNDHLVQTKQRNKAQLS